jgi:hypothetical protein
MEAKHTPGPWHFYRGFRSPSVKTVGDRVHICTLSTARASAVSDGRPLNQAVADARLIAAAPELLAALQAEEEWRARDRDGAIDPEWDYEEMVGSLRRAAIAKATGSTTC